MPNSACPLRPLLRNPLRLNTPPQSLHPGTIKGAERVPLPGPAPRHAKAAIFAPFATADTIQAAIGVNQQRQAAGKPGRPLIAANEKEAAQLRALKLQHQEHCRSMVAEYMQDLKSVRKAASHQNTDKFLARAVHELKEGMAHWKNWHRLTQNLLILSNVKGKDLAALSSKDKLYILAHGEAGSNSVYSLDAADRWIGMTASELAARLKTDGLRSSFRDVRVTSCYSADARPPNSFDAHELQACAQPCIKRVKGKPVLKLPFAEHLNQAMLQQGFTATSVTGYHGRALPFQLIGTHQKRGLPDDQDTGTRASRVSHQFGPDQPLSRGQTSRAQSTALSNNLRPLPPVARRPIGETTGLSGTTNASTPGPRKSGRTALSAQTPEPASHPPQRGFK